MAVYYKFKSAKDYNTVAMDGPFISVHMLKELIFESKHLGRGTDLVVTNAQTNEDYIDEDMIPKNTSVLIQRVPGRARMPIVREQVVKVENKVQESQPEKKSFLGAESSSIKYPDDAEWDDFGNDLYSNPEMLHIQSDNPITEASPMTELDEDCKIKALIDNPAPDWQHQGRGFGRGISGRMMGQRGFGLGCKTPTQGYICYRCRIPGHFIQHCPTNGNPDFDIKIVKQPTCIQKSTLITTPDGTYAMPSGGVAVLKPNEAAFEKEIEGLLSTRSVGDLPAELHCPLCKEFMKYAVLTSKCCFNSFCDKCIRGYIISKSACVCGATSILADDLLPNKTVRDTITRILESGNGCTDNAGGTFQDQGVEPKVPSPTASIASRGEQNPLPNNKIMQSPDSKEPCNDEKATGGLQQELFETANSNGTELSEKANAKGSKQAPGNLRAGKVPDVSEAANELMTVEEAASRVLEKVQQEMAPVEAGREMKRKTVGVPSNEVQCKNHQDLAENYVMPMAPSSFNSYWGGMQPGMGGLGGPFAGAIPYVGYGLGSLDMPFGGMMPQDPFAQPGFMITQDPFAQPGYMMPPVPYQRGMTEFCMGMNVLPAVMSKEEFEAWKKDVKQRRGGGRKMRGLREFSRNSETDRGLSTSPDVSTLKSKSHSVYQTSGADLRHHKRYRSERTSPDKSISDLGTQPLTRKSDHSHDRDIEQGWDQGRERACINKRIHHHHHPKSSSRRFSEPARTDENKKKSNVFSRISFTVEEPSSKRCKGLSSNEADGTSSSVCHRLPSNGSNEHYKSSLLVKAGAATSSGGRKYSTAVGYGSSDDDSHFKRRPSRYEPSPAPEVECEEVSRHARRSKEKGKKHNEVAGTAG